MASALGAATCSRAMAAVAVKPTVGKVTSNLPVQWKDVVYNAVHALRLCMYRPIDDNTTTANNKLSMLVYFHGGGFCLCSFELPHFHADALRLTTELPTLVLSADYHLALEHRLPTTHRDAKAILSWLRA
ncbi:carboxylesterase 15-like [Miscanthus floridulus]|uniref:carboxylesterase 15-like n=1 Tax=Miscanthus floridulus TaxID=154761 RepID=UPI0034593DCD